MPWIHEHQPVESRADFTLNFGRRAAEQLISAGLPPQTRRLPSFDPISNAPTNALPRNGRTH